MLFRHSEAFLFIRFGPVLSLQHHAPPTLSHRPLLSFHSTPSVPLIPLIQSYLPAAPLRLSCSPSPHSMAVFPIHSFRSVSSSPSPVPALPLRSTLHLQYRPTLLADTAASRLSPFQTGIPSNNCIQISQKNKKRRGEGGESKPTGQNAHNVAPVSRLFNISERLFGNPKYNVATSHPQFFPSARCTTVAKPSSAPPGICEKGRTIAGFCEQVSPGPSWPWRSPPPRRLWRSPSERRPTRPRLQ